MNKILVLTMVYVLFVSILGCQGIHVEGRESGGVQGGVRIPFP